MSVFKLQQFSITQTQNAMKVCTDALIFGALIPVFNIQHALYIGTGTGILSLMMKQRGVKKITAIELIKSSAHEAALNIKQSPWPNDIDVIHHDFNTFSCNIKFDLIVSNPPFFDNHLKNQSTLRNTARHTDTLDYRSLLRQSEQHLSESGMIVLLLPIHTKDTITQLCAEFNLSITTQVNLVTMVGGKAKLAVFEIKRHVVSKPLKLTASQLTIFSAHQQYTEQSTRLLTPFLLRFSQ